MKFKTNAKCGGCVAAIKLALKPEIESERIEFDLSSPDKVMTIEGDLTDAQRAWVMDAVARAGFQIAPL